MSAKMEWNSVYRPSENFSGDQNTEIAENRESRTTEWVIFSSAVSISTQLFVYYIYSLILLLLFTLHI